MSDVLDASPSTYDAWFDLLADGLRRRLLLDLTAEAPPPASLAVPEDLVREEEDPERLHVQLSHIHLPKLAAARVIEWRPGSEVVSTGPAFERMLPLLTTIESFENLEAN